ncbi:PAS domain-containing protein [Undibacterium seohonense]|uniref:histidine kinase n=1 Tax=Undibacterium seohonense TaxID=1344950 RepID=A0ABR6X5P7_9BURK|nr:PAS domain-containing protein [Undibacterium seohonense]MBC3807968.1 PAS domain-containing protein [Undibacterium seohonense]
MKTVNRFATHGLSFVKKFWLSQRWLLPRYLPTAIFILGMCFATAGTWWLNHNEKNKLEREFQSRSERVVNEIQQRFTIPVYGLNGIKSLFGINQHLSSSEFRDGILTHNLTEEYPGLRGFGYVEQVPKADLDSYIQRQKATGNGAITFQEFGDNPGNMRYIAKYFESPFTNHFVAGTDFGSDRRRLEAINEAINSGLPSMSPLIYAPPKTEKKASVLLFVPIFKKGLSHGTPANRQQAVLGLVYTPILVNDLLSSIADIDQDIVQFELNNTEGYGNVDTTKYFSANVAPGAKDVNPADASQTPTSTQVLRNAMFTTTRTITLHRHNFKLVIASTAIFEAKLHRTTPIAFFFAMSLISALLASLLKIQLGISEQIQKQLDAAVRDNEALLSTLNMHAIVSVTDASGCILDVNDAFCRISGYTRENLLGQNHRIISSKEQPSQFWSDIWENISTGTPWRGAVCNRARDGSLYWVDTFIAPFKNIHGVIEKYIAICTDITESKMAAQKLQAALRDSDALLSTLNMHAIVSIANGAGKIIDVNQAYCRISGYSREEILEGNHKIVATGVQSPDFLSTMWRTISSGTPWRGEVCNRTKNGNLYWVDTFIAPFKSADGHIEKFISIRTDITASKKAASRLANQRSALAHIIEGTNVGTWEWNIETGEMRLNERWADQVGYELNELGTPTIQTWDDLTHPEDLSRVKALMAKHFAHDLTYYECENRLRHKDGHWIWVLTRGRVSSYTPLGKPEWVSGTQMDITERKTAEAELHRSTQRLLAVRDQLSKAAEVAQLGIWSWDIANNKIVFNDRMYEIYEIPQANRLEKLTYDFWRSKVHPDDIAETEERLKAALEDNHVYSPIFRIISPTQGIRYIQAAGGVEYDENGKAILVTGINRDITLQYHAEETLRQAKQAADEASQAKSAFLANMSHEIRTPMNAILGMLSLLRKTALTPQQNDYASKTEGAARSLLNLLNDILDISKVEAGKMSLDPHPFRLDQLLIDLSDLLSINIGTKPVDILYDIDPHIPNRLIGDALRLRQILTNLGSNAVKFTEQGEVIMSIRAVAQTAESVTLNFSVKDTGIGIAAENHDKIFTGFTQAETSTTRRFGGSGLGISISQGLVDMMGGKLELESELGKGSRFYFTIDLPIATQTQAALENSKEQEKSVAILVAEANIFVREHIKGACKDLHIEPEFVDSSQLALQILQSHRHDYQAVLIDWDSIETDGWGIIREISEQCQQGSQHMLLLMRETEQELFQRASPKEQRLFDQILVKPVNTKKLADHLLSKLDRSKQSGPAGARTLQNLRILLVEDNLNNQQVARELLEAEGATVLIANHGLEAIELVANERLPFDLVLMDLQMPVMDGFTASRKIRTELGRAHLPIIAMSANVMESDKAACLAAGLNDHIGKPFDLQDLVQVILRHTARDHLGNVYQSAANARENTELSSTAAQLGIDIYPALNRLGGKQDLYLRMLEMYRKDLQLIPAQLLSSLPDNLNNTLRHLHTMKGLSATLGANQHANTLAGIEKEFNQAAAQQQISECRRLIEQTCQLVTEFDLQLATLANYLHTNNATATLGYPSGTTSEVDHSHDAFDPLVFRRRLLDLSEQLDNADMAATETILELQNAYRSKLGAHLAPLENAITTLDFVLAQQLCAAILENSAIDSQSL